MTLCRAIGVVFLFGVLVASEPPANDDQRGVVDRIREAAIALESFDDLDPLVTRIGDDVRLVLLGESTHGTHEFYTWRGAISRKLLTDRGFNFIAVEGDWAAIAELDRYVRDRSGGADSARDVLLTFDRWPVWMWANEEIVELAEWLRRHNDALSPDERVGIFGIDVYGAGGAVEKALRLLREVDEELAQRAEDAYSCFAAHADDARQYVQRIVQSRESCEDDVVGVVSMIREARSAIEDDEDDRLFRAKLSALAVKRAERHYRFNLVGRAESWNARAEHFYHATEHLLERFGEDSRGIVWAHNTHIGDVRATPMGQQRMVNIGQMARDGLGRDAVMLIGFSTHEGEAIAGRAWDARPERMRVPAAAPRSIDAALNEAGAERFVVFTSDLAGATELAEPISMRAIGVTYQPERERIANYSPSMILERFDAIVFLRETKALVPLRDSDERERSGH